MNGLPVPLVIMVHGGVEFGTAENLKLVIDFLDKYLK
jgi:hypothetical protein